VTVCLSSVVGFASLIHFMSQRDTCVTNIHVYHIGPTYVEILRDFGQTYRRSVENMYNLYWTEDRGMVIMAKIDLGPLGLVIFLVIIPRV